MKNILLSTLTLAALATGIQTALANNESNTLQKTAVSSIQNQKTWLGVSLAPVPKVLSKQLGNLIPENQGVMVQSVSPNSPASKAGIQPYDVLLRFNDQKLYSAQQLAGLVSANKKGSEIALNIVRKGKSEDLKVTLESHTVAASPLTRNPFLGFNQQPFPHPRMPMLPPMGATSGTTSNVMQQFESFSINQTGDGNVRAEVSFENNGDKKEFTFEGSYDEVRKQIKDTKELPEDKKNGLLNALQNKPNQLIPDDFFKGFGQMPNIPSFNGFFNHQPQAPSWFSNGSKL